MMAITLKDGGPAFPHVVRNNEDDVTHGMSMKQWYAAHAPNVPEWFRLDAEGDPPKVPAVPKEWNTAERAEFAMLKESTIEACAVSDDVAVFWRRYAPARARLEEWRDKMKARKFFAWRWHYADMMIKTEQE